MKSINVKRLTELRSQVESLEQRQAEQQATVMQLQRELHQTRESDLNAEAASLHSGTGRKPKPKAPGIERALEAAQHDLEVIQRALMMAQTDLGRYYSKNHETLMRKLQEAKRKKAQEVAEHAKPLLEALREYQLPDLDMQTLRPYVQQPQEENHGEAASVSTVWTPINTSNVFGQDRIAGQSIGQVEAIVGELADLAARYEQGGATVVGEQDASEAGAA